MAVNEAMAIDTPVEVVPGGFHAVAQGDLDGVGCFVNCSVDSGRVFSR